MSTINSLGPNRLGGLVASGFHGRKDVASDGFDDLVREQPVEEETSSEAPGKSAAADEWAEDESQQHAPVMEPVEEHAEEASETSDELAALESEMDDLLNNILRAT